MLGQNGPKSSSEVKLMSSIYLSAPNEMKVPEIERKENSQSESNYGE